MQDEISILDSSSKVLRLRTQESGVANGKICVGRLDAHTRQVGEAEQGGAGRVHGEGVGADGDEEVQDRIYCPGLSELVLPV